MKEIYKRDLDHELLLMSQDSGPFHLDEYSYLLYKQTTADKVKLTVEDRTMVSITTIPYTRPKPGYQLLYTDWEASKIPSFYRDSTDMADVILVPSTFAKEAFVAGCISTPVKVVPHGVDTDVIPLQPVPSGKFTFLSVAVDDWRKGLDVLIKAFTEEFKSGEAILKLRSSISVPKNKNIQIVNDKIPFSRMGDIYKGAHAFVLPTRGEGYCLPALEAMASGLPVIITNGSGHLEFLGSDFFPIDVERDAFRPAHEGEYETIRYMEPSVTSCREQMRQVYDNWEYARKRALNGTIRVRDKYTWSNTLDIIVDLI